MIYNVCITGKNIVMKCSSIHQIAKYMARASFPQMAISVVEDKGNLHFEVSRPMNFVEREQLKGFLRDSWFEIDLDRIEDFVDNDDPDPTYA